MRQIGLRNVSVDDAPNAAGVIPGRSTKALVFVATLDDLATVAEYQKAALQPPHVTGDRVVGPGTNTSSTTAAMLAAAEAIVRTGIKPEQELIGPGGHSLDGGLPNVNQAIARSVDRILSLPYPQQNQATHTTINVAMLQSGSVFNHKPETGWFSLDIRSMDNGDSLTSGPTFP